MTTYKEALEKLQTDSPELAEVIKTHVAGINNESADRRVKLADALKIVEAIKAIAGAEEDLVKFVTDTKKKADSTSTSAADLQAKLDAALALANTQERSYLLLKASQVSKADEKALAEMLKDVSNDKIEVGEEVKVEGKPLAEYAEAKGKFWSRALFSTEPSNPASKDEPLPTGGGKQPDDKINPAIEHIEAQAAGIAARINAK